VDPDKVRGLGFDGSQSRDGTALYGSTDDGFVFVIAQWFAPRGSSKTWKVPRDEVMQVLRESMEDYPNAVLYADPPLWQNELAELMDEFSSRSERVVQVPTASAVRFAPMCERFATAVVEGHVSHDGDSALTEALSACVRKQVRLRDDPEDMRTRFVVEKAKPRKNDCAIAAILAFAAAMEAPAPPITILDAVW
jgi:phage terminase large subunit-like protein